MMNATGESDEKLLVQDPVETREQQGFSQQGLTPLVRSPPTNRLDRKRGKSQPFGPRMKASLDEARFTAGIVQFYEAVLSEPVPGKMLRLIEEIVKRERGE